MSVWVEILFADKFSCLFWSRSTWACELKSLLQRPTTRLSSSRSTWACELKYSFFAPLAFVFRHAPRERVSWNERGFENGKIFSVTLHVSVWVEIFHHLQHTVLFSSRSTWACELKSEDYKEKTKDCRSRSTWACELKYYAKVLKQWSRPSRSTWACELKYAHEYIYIVLLSHAPRERVSWNP